MTPVVDLTRKKGTGAVRTRRPIYVDLLPPCNNACPAGENIQAWLALAQAGRWKEAWEQLISDNPLPTVHGRVCYHPCETACNRRELDGAVSIHAVERFLGDLALRNGWKVPVTAQPSGKRVLVVGAGPGGLSAGYHLKRLGHDVEIHDAGPLMRFDPGLRRAGLNPFQLDSPRPTVPLKEYQATELRYKSLVDSRPQEGAELSAMAQVVATERYRKYEELARTDGSHFHPATESVSEACIKFDDPAHVAADALGRVAGFAESGSPTNGAPLIQYPDLK